NAIALNLRNRMYKHYDGAGVVTDEHYDFKGNLLSSSRQLAREYRQQVDWSPLTDLTKVQDIINAAAALLETENFTSSTAYDAQQTMFFGNASVSPNTQYEYDALYRLTKADGREHIGQNANTQPDYTDIPLLSLVHPNDGQAMRRYSESYDYDSVGNILGMIHQ